MSGQTLDDVTVLFVPGLRDHVDDHWQTHAARALPGSVTVEPLSTQRLSREARVAALDTALNAIEGDVIIAAHSAGCLMVAHWAETPTRKVRAALLVTPADVEHPLPAGYPTPDDLKSNDWVPVARTEFPFPTLVVGSRNDPLGEFERIAGFAESWGAKLHDAGEVGHLNPPAGYGPWADAIPLLEQMAEATKET